MQNNKSSYFPLILGLLFLIALGGFAGIGGYLMYKERNNEQELGRGTLHTSAFPHKTIVTNSSTLSTLTGGEYTGTSTSTPMILGTSTSWAMQDPIYREIQIGQDVDQVDLNIWFEASTSDAVLNWRYYFSHDGQLWFAEDTKSTAGNTVTHSAATTTHQLTPGTANEMVWRNITIPNMASEYVKIEFFRSSNLSGGKLYSDVITK